MVDFVQHFKDRHLDPDRYHVYWDENVACFLLFNLTGKIVGYQQYRPFAPKTLNNDPILGRYYTFVPKILGLPDGRKAQDLACWGLETLHYRKDILFLTEGIFDACRLHNFGLPAIALLSNHPKPFSGWLSMIKDRIKIAICDNDLAGKKLARLGDRHVFTSGKDLGEMTDIDIQHMVEGTLNG